MDADAILELAERSRNGGDDAAHIVREWTMRVHQLAQSGNAHEMARRVGLLAGVRGDKRLHGIVGYLVSAEWTTLSSHIDQ